MGFEIEGSYNALSGGDGSWDPENEIFIVALKAPYIFLSKAKV